MIKILKMTIVLITITVNCSAEILYTENYEGSEWDSVANCSDGNPDGGLWVWNDQGENCYTDTYQDITHYAGEVSSPGRGGTGKALKQWRHSGAVFMGYAGKLDSHVTPGTYRDLYQRYYIKWPNGLTVPTGVGTKFDRAWIYPTEGSEQGQVSVMAVPDLGDDGVIFTYIQEMNTNYEIIRTQTFAELGLNDGNWHSVEYHYRINDPGQANGEFEIWIDGYMIPLKYNQDPDEWTPNGASTPPEKIYGENAGLGLYDISGTPDNFYYSSPIDPSIGNTGNSSSPYVCTPDEWMAMEWDDFVVSTTYIGLDTIFKSVGTSPLRH